MTESIAQCCKWGKNRELFGRHGAVAPLVKYLKSSNQDVHTSTAKALHQLSKSPENCITMHENGVVRVCDLKYIMILELKINTNYLFFSFKIQVIIRNGWFIRWSITRKFGWLYIIYKKARFS